MVPELGKLWRLVRVFALVAFAISLFTLMLDVVVFLALQYHHNYESADHIAAEVLGDGAGVIAWGLVWDTVGRHLGVK